MSFTKYYKGDQILGVVGEISTDVTNAYEDLAREPEKYFTNLDVKRILLKLCFIILDGIYMDLLRVDLWALVKI